MKDNKMEKLSGLSIQELMQYKKYYTDKIKMADAYKSSTNKNLYTHEELVEMASYTNYIDQEIEELFLNNFLNKI